MKQVFDKSVEKVTYDILERIFPKVYDLDARLVEDVKEIITKYRLALIDAEIERLKGMKWDGKEWIEMMKSAGDAGFSTMKSPEDFIAGKNQALTDVLTYLKEQREIISNQ